MAEEEKQEGQVQEGQDQDIDWDDPAAVAAARGDNPTDTGEQKDGMQEGSEEGEDAPKKEVKDEKDEKGEKDGDHMIPKSRYDSKAAEARALKEENDRLKQAQQKQETDKKSEDARGALNTEIAELDKAYHKAINDDDSDKAVEIRGQIRAKEQALWKMDLDASSTATSSMAREQMRLDMTIDHIEQNYPQFNPDKDEYDQEIVGKVEELRRGFEATGSYTPTQALLKAIDYVLPSRDVKTITDASDAAGKKAQERRQEGLKKATDAAGKTPPDLDGVGDDASAAGLKGTPDIDKLSYEDLEKLPEATLKRMRGDFA